MVEVTGIKITQHTTHWDRREWHADLRPFSEIKITTADGRHYLSRVPWAVPDSPHTRAAQLQDFLRRQGRPLP